MDGRQSVVGGTNLCLSKKLNKIVRHFAKSIDF